MLLTSEFTIKHLKIGTLNFQNSKIGNNQSSRHKRSTLNKRMLEQNIKTKMPHAQQTCISNTQFLRRTNTTLWRDALTALRLPMSTTVPATSLQVPGAVLGLLCLLGLLCSLGLLAWLAWLALLACLACFAFFASCFAWLAWLVWLVCSSVRLFVAPAGINFALTTSMVHTAQSGRVAPQMPKGESSSGCAPSSNRFFTMSACGGLPGPLKDRQCGCLGILAAGLLGILPDHDLVVQRVLLWDLHALPRKQCLPRQAA